MAYYNRSFLFLQNGIQHLYSAFSRGHNDLHTDRRSQHIDCRQTSRWRCCIGSCGHSVPAGARDQACSTRKTKVRSAFYWLVGCAALLGNYHRRQPLPRVGRCHTQSNRMVLGPGEGCTTVNQPTRINNDDRSGCRHFAGIPHGHGTKLHFSTFFAGSSESIHPFRTILHSRQYFSYGNHTTRDTSMNGRLGHSSY